MTMKNILIAAALAATTFGSYAAEQAPAQKTAPKTTAAKTLDELLKLVKQNKIRKEKVNKEREARFLRERNNQRALLNQAKAEQKREEERTERLKAQYAANEKKLSELEEELTLKAGALGEMVGVVRQVAGDTAARFRRSLISAQKPGRFVDLEKLAQAKEFPQIPEIRNLWVQMQDEITEQGKVLKFNADVIDTAGKRSPRDLIRIGAFNLISGGQYLVFDSETQSVKELSRQPERFLGFVEDFERTTSGYAPLAIDPSRGSILAQEVKRESWKERVEKYAGVVGWAIVVVLFVGLAIVVERIVTLLSLRSKMRAQAKSSTPGNNPLGRIMAVYLANKDDDVENLELKLDEAVLKETPRIERGIGMIKVFAAVAPLMGLLGTVTGMIETFQSITLYGAGDPKVMAGGISSALITTVLGIVAAIPLILTHSLVSGISKNLIHMLEEQSTGLIAQHEEEAGA